MRFLTLLLLAGCAGTAPPASDESTEPTKAEKASDFKLRMRLHFELATMARDSVIQGDLIVEKPGGWGWNKEKRKPRIVIGGGSRIVGVIKLERDVELLISDTAEVGGVTGEMSIDDAVRFSGDRP